MNLFISKTETRLFVQMLYESHLKCFHTQMPLKYYTQVLFSKCLYFYIISVLGYLLNKVKKNLLVCQITFFYLKKCKCYIYLCTVFLNRGPETDVPVKVEGSWHVPVNQSNITYMYDGARTHAHTHTQTNKHIYQERQMLMRHFRCVLQTVPLLQCFITFIKKLWISGVQFFF